MYATTTVPALRGHRTDSLSAVSTVRELHLRTLTLFVNAVVPARHPEYHRLQREHLIERGLQLISVAADRIQQGLRIATLRLIPPTLDDALSHARSREEAREIARAEFAMREAVGKQLNARLGTLGLTDTAVFLGGYMASALKLSPFTLDGFLDAVLLDLGPAKYQFGGLNLGGAEGIPERALCRAAETIAALGVGGTRFCAMFGDAEYTPFCPCASHTGDLEGLSVGMSGPDLLLAALDGPMAPEDAVAGAQCQALLQADCVGRQVAGSMNVAYFGVDPSQAPVFDAADPHSRSIGAVIERFSGAPLGLAGTKDGFFRLMRGLRRGGAQSGVLLCGFRSGSFLPVAEDAVVAEAVAAGRLTYVGIMDLCHVCAAGLDMAVLEPGTSPATVTRILRDIAATHLIKGKALAVRVIVPVVETPTDSRAWYVFGGLLGSAPVLPLR